MFERTWLGVVRATLHDRAMETGWRPDVAGAYCARCGRTAGAHEAIDPLESVGMVDAGCGECRGVELPWERFVRIGEYEGLLREVVLEVKFSRWRRVGEQVGALLGGAIGEQVLRGAEPGGSAARVGIVPVPTHPWRRMMRGIDHTRVYAGAAAGMMQRMGARAEVMGVLARRWRVEQSRLSNAKRRKNVKGTMKITSRGRRAIEALSPGDVLLVLDDVRTTGATLMEACDVLRASVRADVAVWAGVVACAGAQADIAAGRRAGNKLAGEDRVGGPAE
jgi:predicted amidophosphoribosyltransferase